MRSQVTDDSRDNQSSMIIEGDKQSSMTVQGDGVDIPAAIPFVSADMSSPSTVVTLLGAGLIALAFGRWVYGCITRPDREAAIMDEIARRTWDVDRHLSTLDRRRDVRQQIRRQALADAFAQTQTRE